MNTPFEATYQVEWADLDLNGHMANSRYLDYGTQTRFLCAAERGFGPPDFQRYGIGPAIFEDRIRYRRELRFLDKFTVTHGYDPEPDDPRKFRVTNVFRRQGELVAEVEATGAWIDLAARKLVEPPPELVQALTSPAVEGDAR